ncbi:MAG: nucleotidyltransferase family protein [Planctomycetaceae bacterium]
MAVKLHDISIDRMVNAVEKVRNRLMRATRTLEDAGIPYAVVGGNAVAAWVARVDESAVRNTRDVDILLRRDDLPAAQTALEAAGFVYRHVRGIDMFLDGPEAKARDAVHVVFAGEKIQPDSLAISPDVDQQDRTGDFAILDLQSLVTMKLTSYRLKDRVHLQDMLDIGLIDETWLSRIEPGLKERLQEVLDNPTA